MEPLREDGLPVSPDVPVLPPDPAPDERLVDRAPGWALLLLLGVVVAVPVLAFTVSAEAAAWFTAGALTLVAVLRVLTPAAGLFAGRTRLSDVVVLLLLAAGVSALAPWAATLDIVL